ncbi:MAG: sulfatase-like hydrolase/transferase [Bacteroidota bacterium]|nr:sulfatase-like hydrolase/transferase [Bacteroidota bacterium]
MTSLLKTLKSGSIIGLASTLLPLLFSCSQHNKKLTNESQPNIIVIIADDMGWHDVGYHGSEIKTPTIDRLAQEGIEFERFYVHSVCSPTRASLLTGRTPSRYGIHAPLGDKAGLPAGTVTIAELLRQNGYETAISGKWHLGTVPEGRPMNYGFNSSYGYLRGQIDPYTHLYKDGNKTWHKNDTLKDEEGHATDLITDEAIRFIKKPRENNIPFFLYVAYSVPHYPLEEPKEWVDIYKQTIGNESRRLFAASVTHMDYCIEQILSTLREERVEENTLVLFLSDNGGQKSWYSKTQYNGRFKGNDVLGDNRPLRDWKASLYDGALRVPAVLSWQGRLQRQKITEAINVADIYPTLAYLAGVNISEELSIDGVNFWPSVEGGSLPEERIMYWRMNNGTALKKGDWKLIHHGRSLVEGTDELYNVTLDPSEKMNMAQEYPEKVAVLKKEIEYQMFTDDKVIRKMK